mmetsp:Transcript_17486/g.54421  ORF Transcript_17486/g.54421 Transcript_17486/m.54421 type:complete len:361 (-) Transcript_17486:1212-2294(-)
MPVGQRSATRTGMILDPRGEELAREPAHAHSRHMSGPAELAIRDEPQNARHVEAGVKRPVAAGIIPDIPARDTAHGPHASVVERFELVLQRSGQQPALTSIEQNLQHKAVIESAFGAERQGPVAKVHPEDGSREHAKLCTRCGNAPSDLLVIGEGRCENGAQVAEPMSEGDYAIVVVDSKWRKIIVCGRGASSREEHGLCLGSRDNVALIVRAAAVHHQPEAQQMRLEQASTTFEIRTGQERSASVVRIQARPQVKAVAVRTHIAPSENTIWRSAKAQRWQPVLLENWLQCLHGSLDHEEEEDGSHVVPLLDAHGGVEDHLDAAHGELDAHVGVQHANEADEMRRDPVFAEYVQHGRSVD